VDRQDNLTAFGDLQRFKNRDVEIRGTISDYYGKPEVILESPEQIQVSKGK
jgi:DNA/RNA endonuclease YhcR with UshA esterase domain